MAWLFGIVLCAVAADEVQWDYTPSGRDQAMGMEFDEVGKAFTQSGPHRIGHVY